MNILFDDAHSEGSSPPVSNRSRMESQDPTVAGTVVHVVVRLIDGDQVVAGSFTDPEEARRTAEGLLGGFSQENGTWPFVEGRYLRPQAVVSIDIVEEEHRRWSGSAERAAIRHMPNSAA